MRLAMICFIEKQIKASANQQPRDGYNHLRSLEITHRSRVREPGRTCLTPAAVGYYTASWIIFANDDYSSQEKGRWDLLKYSYRPLENLRLFLEHSPVFVHLCSLWGPTERTEQWEDMGGFSALAPLGSYQLWLISSAVPQKETKL